MLRCPRSTLPLRRRLCAGHLLLPLFNGRVLLLRARNLRFPSFLPVCLQWALPPLPLLPPVFPVVCT